MANHFIDYIEAFAAEMPDRDALVVRSESGATVRLTFSQLDQRLNRAASVLADLGVEPGMHVGCHMYDTLAHVDVMLGAWKMGAVPINVNFRYVADELAYLFDDADLAVVVSEPDLEAIAREAAERVPKVRHVLSAGDAWERRLAAATPTRPNIERSGDEHYILYTGGTTGLPKGVVYRHADALYAAFGAGPVESLGIPAAESAAVAVATAKDPPFILQVLISTLSLLPLMHGGGQWALGRALLRGGKAVLISDRHFDPAFALRVMREEDIAIVWGAGDAHARPIAEAVAAIHGGSLELPCLKLWVTGAVMLTREVKQALESALPGTMVLDGLGASETGGQAEGVGYSDEGSPKFKLSEGTLVLDDDLRPIRPGDTRVGRLAKQGHIPLGYYKDPEKTARTFPVIDGVRYAVPGDLASVDVDGIVTLYGRGSLCINSGGEKVFPEEVEKAVKTHPAVYDVLVVGAPDVRLGNKVTAVVELRPGYHEPNLEDVADHCRKTLAGYKVPRALVVCDAIVRSPSGKPDYRWAADVAKRAQQRA